MPTHGHEFGVDTARQLRDLNNPNLWAQIAAWRAAVGNNPANPVFAARYFFPGHVWVDGETRGVKKADPNANPPAQPTNPNLAYVVPLQGPGAAPFNRVQGLRPNGHREDEATVRKWGADDAKTTCTNIMHVVKNKELDFSTTLWETVVVYLDVEPGVNLSPHYWYGWASKVYWFCNGIHRPFYPGLYCATMHNPDDHGANQLLHRIPTGPGGRHGDVQTGLTAAPNNLASMCYGIFATFETDNTGFQIPQNHPAWAVHYRQNFYPDWGEAPNSRFDEWQQTVHMIFGLIPWKSGVPVLLWQYAAQSNDPNNPSPQAFDDLHVDLDETSPDGNATKWMLILP